MIEELLKFINNDNPIICYGAGAYGSDVLGYLQRINRKPEMFVTTNIPHYITKLGIPVVQISDVDCSKSYNWIVSANGKNTSEIINILESKNIQNRFIIDEKLLLEIKDKITKNNEEIKDLFKGERCFIVAAGPSIRKQNLSLLRKEHVFTCSFLTLTDFYKDIQPEFYVDASINKDYFTSAFDNKNHGELGLELLRFQDKVVASRTVFFDCSDISLVQQSSFGNSRKIYYLNQDGKWRSRSDIYDLTKETPQIQTVSIMMLKIAMYMGFRKIYLLGTEHNLESNSTYEHIYNYEKMRVYGFDKLCDEFVNNNKQTGEWPRRRKLKAMLNIFDQYYYLHEIAKKNGIEIYNATEGGSLDEFERVSFNKLF